MLLVCELKEFQGLMIGHRAKGESIGFVPTMGALHAGHLSLAQAAKKENDISVVSIFVNPNQFGPKEDFSKYPRTLKADMGLLKKVGIDYIFAPSANQMYAPDSVFMLTATSSKNNKLISGLCGKFRPGHFEGVATVVAKLFNLAQPTRAYFGAKDYQQCAVIKQMILDMNFPVEFKQMPIVRESDGLAMSSRNRYLSVRDRARAAEISKTLFWMRDQIDRGARDSKSLVKAGKLTLSKAVDRIQYLEIVDAKTLQPMRKIQGDCGILTACFIGKTRLIDNVILPTSR